ncbi:MAG: tetratricopeptide repeat protein [Gemmatimonadetes bacterium]|nr:tetratricopeptide repeat protein [Gemmatimonadota bacterium]
MAPAARVDELKKRYEENPRRFFAPLANEYRKVGDLEAAIDLCRMHLEEQPGHLSGHIVYGQALFESSRAAEAKRVFEAALTLDPENLIALRHLGDIAKADGDATAAKHWYGRVLEADPRNDEVIALIDALGQAAPTPTVVLAAQHEPPPPPNYAAESAPAVAVDPSAPTPAVPITKVPPAAPAPRLSIGLMDLDLNLSDSATPTVDLLGSMPAEPSAPDVPAEPVAASMAGGAPPAVDEPAPAIDEGFALIDTASSAPEVEGSGMPGVEGISLGAGVGSEPAVDVLDTSFDAPPAEEESMFAAAQAEPSFGDSLDVTASADFETTTAPADEPTFSGLEMVDVGETVPIGESVTEPKPAPAAPATPADFDALFGNAPIADVQIGGDQNAAPVEEAGFHADSFVGREPADAILDAAPDIATPPSPFVTETMAELYLQQGFRDEALNVYRQLLAQNPDDQGLAERVKHLEHGTRSSLAIDAVSEEIEAAELRRTESTPTVPAEPVAAPAMSQPEPEPAAPQHEPAPVIELMPELEPATPEAVAPLAEAVPAFLVEAPAEVAPKTAPVGPLARDILLRIASRRAVPGGGFAASTASAPTTVPAEGDVTVAPGGAVDQLFGMSGVAAVDERTAITIAAAFGAAPPEAPIRGEPTRAGTDELSLDSVFGSDAHARPSVVQRQSSTLRFDQFFSGAEGGASAPAAPPPIATPAADDDIAQFSDWLKGLKGS